MLISNANFGEIIMEPNDLYVFNIGFEERSGYLLQQCITYIHKLNTIVFLFKNHTQNNEVQFALNELRERSIPIIEVEYTSGNLVVSSILKLINVAQNSFQSLNIHIDYSSMPRSWYCTMPIILKEDLRYTDQLHFWYSEGIYPDDIKFPSSGIGSFSFCSGKPSLNVNRKRVHVLGLGFDVNRTEAIVSILDPAFLVNCYAYNPGREGFKEKLESENEKQKAQQLASIELDLGDFDFMISKIKETVIELLVVGDVILVPDGPKPLIFAMSMMPDLIDKVGVTCLQISKNKKLHKPIEVIPTGVIHGFSARLTQIV